MNEISFFPLIMSSALLSPLPAEENWVFWACMHICKEGVEYTKRSYLFCHYGLRGRDNKECILMQSCRTVEIICICALTIEASGIEMAHLEL